LRNFGAPRRGDDSSVNPNASPRRLFDQLNAGEGRPSISPAELLKNRLVMAPYSVGSECPFCEYLAYNLLPVWFLKRELDEANLDLAMFTHN